MTATVKGARKFGIDERLEALRLQVVASEIAARIGRRLRQRRDELGLTQKQVAKAMPSPDVEPQRISDWERGYNKPTERYLNELVIALKVPDISWFYETEEQDEETPDVLGALNGNSTQLDRIERAIKNLDEQVRKLRVDVLGPPEAGERRLSG